MTRGLNVGGWPLRESFYQRLWSPANVCNAIDTPTAGSPDLAAAEACPSYCCISMTLMSLKWVKI
jgi:hypothetical protein